MRYLKNLFTSVGGAGLLLSTLSMAHTEKRRDHDAPIDTVIEVAVSTREARGELANLGYALEDIRSDKAFIFGAMSDVTRLQAAGFKAEGYRLKDSWKAPGLKSAPTRRFTSYQDVVKRANALANQRPDLFQVLSLGRSYEGRDTPLLRISSKSLGEAQSQQLPSVFYMGCHHSREPLSVEVPLEFAEYLVKNYDSNATIKRLIDTREIYVAPIINPDGYVYDYQNGQGGKMWRKNRRPNGDGSYGVDLNRNYAYKWGTSGISRHPGDDTYLGPSAFSENESRNVKTFIDTQTRLTNMITFHSFAEQILYPWSYDYETIAETHPQWREDLDIFKKMGDAMSGFNGYTSQQSSEMYPSSGDTSDWAYAEHRVYAFTIELSPDTQWEGGFYPNPDTAIQSAFAENLKPMLYLTEYADDPSRVLSEETPNFDVSPSKAGVRLASTQDLKF